MSLNRERERRRGEERGGGEGGRERGRRGVGREGGSNTAIQTFLQQSGEVRMTIVRKQEFTTSRIAQLLISLRQLP